MNGLLFSPIIVGGAVENLHADDEFFQLGRAILQCVFYGETQEPAHPFRMRKTLAGKDSLELQPDFRSVSAGVWKQ